MIGDPGYCCIVLHTHLPYVHHPEYEDFLEEDWFFEAVVDTYLPLLDAFRRLEDEGIPFRLAMSLTPPLAFMLRTPDLLTKLDRFLDRRLELAELVARAETEDGLRGVTARHYVERFTRLRDLWLAIDRDPIAALARLQDAGRIEILASAATHGFLPLLGREAAIQAQVRLGCGLYEELFGRAPRGFWLPECAYRPGLEGHLRAAGIEWVVLDHHGVVQAEPRPESAHRRPLTLPEGLHAFGRDPECSEQVWSSISGYPGDPAYRELYRDEGHDADYRVIRPFLKPDGIRRDVGLKFHRVTGKVPLNEKELYDPRAAASRAWLHAGNFLDNRAGQIRHWSATLKEPAVVVAPYDTELFGHWWYEGPLFLEEVFRQAAGRAGELPFRLATPSEVLDAPGSRPFAAPHHSTWGRNGFSEVWCNERNQWIWRHLHEMEERMARRARACEGRAPEGERGRLLRQMGRELLLAESSDWPFIITMETAAHYAERRIRDHVHRFFALEDALDGKPYDPAELELVERHDAVFPALDPLLWDRAD